MSQPVAAALLQDPMNAMLSTPARWASPRGFSIIDMVAVMAIISVIVAVAMPQIGNVLDSMRLGMQLRTVDRELQYARLKSVSTNRPMRVRFDCPAAGQMRVVELIGTPEAPVAADTAADRCSETLYPFRNTGSDANRLTRPNNDGPVRTLDSATTFSASQTLEFRPDGTVHSDQGGVLPWPPLAAAGVAITLTRKTQTKNITVNALGKIQMDR